MQLLLILLLCLLVLELCKLLQKRFIISKFLGVDVCFTVGVLNLLLGC